jgi:ketosteroid isomerase-like protein
MRLSPLFLLGLLVVACEAKPEKQDGAVPAVLGAAALDSLHAVDAAFAAGMNAKDTTAVFAVYAPDAKMLPPDSPILEGAAAHPELAGMIAAGASDFVLKSTTAYGVGDLAYMVGTASFKMGNSAQSVKYAEVLRRGADGKWRYVVDMFSGVVAPPAAAPAKK